MMYGVAYSDNIKIVDNFDLLADKLFPEPLDEDEFYFLQIIQRKKDGNDYCKF